MSSLIEPRRRLDRAHKHLEHLKSLLSSTQASKQSNDLAAIKPQPDGKTYDVFITLPPPPPEFRLAIGDVVHDLRSTLDYMIYRLAILKGFPERGRTLVELQQLQSLQFLIYPD